MSLKSVHLFFVTILTALCFGLTVWKAHDYLSYNSISDLLFAGSSFLVGCLVIWYGRRIYRKLAAFSYL